MRLSSRSCTVIFFSATLAVAACATGGEGDLFEDEDDGMGGDTSVQSSSSNAGTGGASMTSSSASTGSSTANSSSVAASTVANSSSAATTNSSTSALASSGTTLPGMCMSSTECMDASNPCCLVGFNICGPDPGIPGACQ